MRTTWVGWRRCSYMIEIVDVFSSKGCLPPFLSFQTMLYSALQCRQKEKKPCALIPQLFWWLNHFGGTAQLLSFLAPLVTAFSVKRLLFLLSLLIFIGIWHLRIPGCLQTNACKEGEPVGGGTCKKSAPNSVNHGNKLRHHACLVARSHPYPSRNRKDAEVPEGHLVNLLWTVGWLTWNLVAVLQWQIWALILSFISPQKSWQTDICATSRTSGKLSLSYPSFIWGWEVKHSASWLTTPKSDRC